MDGEKLVSGRSRVVTQTILFCGCGRSSILARGMCAYCYHAHYRDWKNFGGQRERTLARDRRRCSNCGRVEESGLGGHIVVHHRRPGVNGLRNFSTLCRACHARVHRLARARFGMNPFLQQLWKEQHEGQPEQLELPLVSPQSPVDLTAASQQLLWTLPRHLLVTQDLFCST